MLVIVQIVLLLLKYNFNSSHIHNVLLLLQLNAKRNFQRFGKSVDRQEWIDYAPATINTFYHSFLNKIGQKLSSLILQ
jgi:predicted metalloendopeptidase